MSIFLDLINYYKNLIQRIVDLLPSDFQKKLKVFYRRLASKQIASLTKKYSHDNFNVSQNKYNLPSKILPETPIGINLLGFPTGESGLAEHLRSVGKALDTSSLDYLYYGAEKFTIISQNDKSVISKIERKIKYNTNIFVCNGDIVPQLVGENPESFQSRYNIHYGAWELRKYPTEWIPTLGLFDEYWAMSSFLQKSVADVAKIPVVHMPYPVDFATPHNITRDDFNLPKDKFLFMFTFDLSSLASRKNPQAVIKAFISAFPGNNDVGLVIKASSKKNLKDHQSQVSEIMRLTNNDPRVHLINEILPREKILGLINCCDVYVSLHRAEGFGIGMAEAMKMNKAVIATNYSGNTDFTLEHNSCLVDYKLIDVKPLEYIYESGKQWADPDIDHAVAHMKKLYEDRAYYKTISSNGKKFIDENYNAKVIMEKYHERLSILGLI